MILKNWKLLSVLFALLFSSCGKHVLTAEERNAAFLAAIAPQDMPSSAKSFLTTCVNRSGVHSFNNPIKRYPTIVEQLLHAEAINETELYASTQVWAELEIRAVDPGSWSRPPTALYGSDWRKGYTIVPHVMPAPEPGKDLAEGARLVFRWVATETAKKTHYHVAPPDGE